MCVHSIAHSLVSLLGEDKNILVTGVATDVCVGDIIANMIDDGLYPKTISVISSITGGTTEVNKERTLGNLRNIGVKVYETIMEWSSENDAHSTVLIAVDIQRCFGTNEGTLAITTMDEVVDSFNTLHESFRFRSVIATKDFHDPHSITFASEGESPFSIQSKKTIKFQVNAMVWPSHCQKDTESFLFERDLALKEKDECLIPSDLDTHVSISNFILNNCEGKKFITTYKGDGIDIPGCPKDGLYRDFTGYISSDGLCRTNFMKILQLV
jgi:nicotinamidase-related amidase